MSRTKIRCQLSATACGTFVGSESHWKGIGLAPEEGAEKNLRVSAINRSPAPLFAHFFWQGRKSGSAKQQLRRCRINGTPVKPDKWAGLLSASTSPLQGNKKEPSGSFLSSPYSFASSSAGGVCGGVCAACFAAFRALRLRFSFTITTTTAAAISRNRISPGSA